MKTVPDMGTFSPLRSNSMELAQEGGEHGSANSAPPCQTPDGSKERSYWVGFYSLVDGPDRIQTWSLSCHRGLPELRAKDKLTRDSTSDGPLAGTQGHQVVNLPGRTKDLRFTHQQASPGRLWEVDHAMGVYAHWVLMWTTGRLPCACVETNDRHPH